MMKNYFVMCFHPAKSITAIPMIENEDGDIAFLKLKKRRGILPDITILPMPMATKYFVWAKVNFEAD